MHKQAQQQPCARGRLRAAGQQLDHPVQPQQQQVIRQQEQKIAVVVAVRILCRGNRFDHLIRQLFQFGFGMPGGQVCHRLNPLCNIRIPEPVDVDSTVRTAGKCIESAGLPKAAIDTPYGFLPVQLLFFLPKAAGQADLRFGLGFIHGFRYLSFL